MPSRRRVEAGGDPSVQRALDAFGADIDDLGARTAYNIPYTPSDPSDWVAPAPDNLGDAVDRLAAAGGVTPVP